MSRIVSNRSMLPMTVENLGFAAEGKTLLHDVTFTLPAGGITALIGANGAGKSLILRLCHGLLKPSAGSVRWNGTDRGGSRQHGMVFQRPVMLRRSAFANIDHAIRASGGGRATAMEALQRFGLGHLADQPARLLSGGEQQRLAIARAWALGPELLMLDEPTSQLDPGATRQIEDIITGLAAESMTIFLTTHDLGQARRLSQRVLFAHKGRLIEDSPTERFFASPAAPEARAFMAGDLLW